MVETYYPKSNPLDSRMEKWQKRQDWHRQNLVREDSYFNPIHSFRESSYFSNSLIEASVNGKLDERLSELELAYLKKLKPNFGESLPKVAKTSLDVAVAQRIVDATKPSSTLLLSAQSEVADKYARRVTSNIAATNLEQSTLTISQPVVREVSKYNLKRVSEAIFRMSSQKSTRTIILGTSDVISSDIISPDISDKQEVKKYRHRKYENSRDVDLSKVSYKLPSELKVLLGVGFSFCLMGAGAYLAYPYLDAFAESFRKKPDLVLKKDFSGEPYKSESLKPKFDLVTGASSITSTNSILSAESLIPTQRTADTNTNVLPEAADSAKQIKSKIVLNVVAAAPKVLKLDEIVSNEKFEQAVTKNIALCTVLLANEYIPKKITEYTNAGESPPLWYFRISKVQAVNSFGQVNIASVDLLNKEIRYLGSELYHFYELALNEKDPVAVEALKSETEVQKEFKKMLQDRLKINAEQADQLNSQAMKLVAEQIGLTDEQLRKALGFYYNFK